ncbi:MAG: putative flagella basal body P-ring formation protein FlgA [Pseudomonadota bacterium]|jgi:flagella basal body P-ring formation protein FlgA
MKRCFSLAWLGLVTWCLSAGLQAQSLPTGVTAQADTAVREFLRQHASLHQRSFTVQWKPLTQRIPPCPQLPVAELARRERAWGALTLRLSCESASPPWSRALALVVQVQGRYPVARRHLRPGTVVQPDDLEWREGDIARFGEPLPEALQALEGLELFRSVAAGAALRLNDFRPIAVIRSGDLVSLILKGQGFEMITTGYALADAAIGVTVRIKTLEGKILQGKAVSPGKVEAVLD